MVDGKIKLAVVGATGMVGSAFLDILQEKKLPVYEYVFFASKRSAGKEIEFLGKAYAVEELTEASFEGRGFDYALFSAGGGTSERFAPLAAKSGCVVIDNSSQWRMDGDVPLIVPEVNAEDMKALKKGIIANPNCSTIQAVVALKPLDAKYGIKRIVYSTYQSVSGAGVFGCKDLEDGLKGEPPKKFQHQIAGNCIPHIDSFLENGYTKEEMKMVHETRKILNKPDIKITATTVRVPVFSAHSESINVELEKDFEIGELMQTLKDAKGIILQDNPQENVYPLALSAAGRDEVFVGRVRRDESVPSGVNMWVVADNIRKGAALNAVQILEELLK